MLSYVAACFCCHANGVIAAFLRLLLSYMCFFQTANIDFGQVGQLITMLVGKGGTCGSLTSNITNVNGYVDVVDGYTGSRKAR